MTRLGHALRVPLWKKLKGFIAQFGHILNTFHAWCQATCFCFQDWKDSCLNIHKLGTKKRKDCQNLIVNTNCVDFGWLLYGMCLSFAEMFTVVCCLVEKRIQTIEGHTVRIIFTFNLSKYSYSVMSKWNGGLTFHSTYVLSFDTWLMAWKDVLVVSTVANWVIKTVIWIKIDIWDNMQLSG